MKLALYLLHTTQFFKYQSTHFKRKEKPQLSRELAHHQQKKHTMITPHRLVHLAKKWQHMAAIGRRRLTTTTMGATKDGGNLRSTQAIADKGHCIVYTADGERFEVPLAYLSTAVFGELLRMSEDEFGFTSEGRITVPCDAVVMEYVMCLLRTKPSADVEWAVLSSVVMPCNCESGVTMVSKGIGQSLPIF